jgi:hypothetical protein
MAPTFTTLEKSAASRDESVTLADDEPWSSWDAHTRE